MHISPRYLDANLSRALLSHARQAALSLPQPGMLLSVLNQTRSLLKPLGKVPLLAQTPPTLTTALAKTHYPGSGLMIVTDGTLELMVSGVIWTLVWIALFYLLSVTFSSWGKSLASSTKPHENDRYWCARNFLGIFHAIVVAALSVPALCVLATAPTSVHFANTEHLADCRVDPQNVLLKDWDFVAQAVALAGLLFTTFTVADIIVSVAHRLATIDYVIHHAAFITAGVIIRGHCMLPFNAAVLLAMEVSTPFLNYVVLFRHRGQAYKFKVIVAGIMFFLTFVSFRIILNTYGTIILWTFQAKGLAMPSTVPTWEGWCLVLAVTAGALVQLFWLPVIWTSFGGKMRSLLSSGDCDTSEEESPRRRLPVQ